MRIFLQLERAITLLSIFILITSCSINTKEQSGNVDSTGQESTNSALVDSSSFFKGETIFRADCNQCHLAKGSLDNHLEGVVQRVGVNYLKLYLSKQDSLISGKDSNALMVKKIYNNRPNSHNFNYTTEELNAIIEYLK